MKNQSAAYVWCGAVFCAFLTVLPDLTAALFAPTDMVWSPVASMNYRYNDSYYSVPWVRLISSGVFFPVTPSSADNIGLGFETARIVPYWISSLPGLLFSDIRLIVVASFAITATMIYVLSFAIAFHFTRNAALAALAGIVSYFFQAQWSYFPAEPWVIAVNPGHWILPYNLRFPWLTDITDTAMINANLRFVMLAGAVPVLLGHYLLCLRCAAHASWVYPTTLVITSLMLAFSYPTHAAVGYLIMGFYFVLSVVTRRWQYAARFGSVIAVALLILFSIGYLSLIGKARETHPLYFELYGIGTSNVLSLVDSIAAEHALWVMLANKYVWATLICLAFAWWSADRRRDVLVLFATSSTVMLIYLTPPDYSILRNLFTQRGVDILWPAVIISVICGGVATIPRFPKIRRAAAILLAVPIVGIPGLSFADYARRMLTENAMQPLLISRSDWDAYAFLVANAKPNREILATDWADITLLPIIAPINLYYGYNALQARPPREIIARYAEANKFLGMSRESYRTMIEETFHLQYKSFGLFQRRSGTMTYPFLKRAEFQLSQFSFAILYWPYVKRMEGVQFTTEDMKQVNPQFTKLALSIFDGSNADTALCTSAVDMIVVNTMDTDAIKMAHERALPELFRNRSRVVYSLDRERICGKP